MRGERMAHEEDAKTRRHAFIVSASAGSAITPGG
jgi:hypothetical protein